MYNSNRLFKATSPILEKESEIRLQEKQREKKGMKTKPVGN